MAEVDTTLELRRFVKETRRRMAEFPPEPPRPTVSLFAQLVWLWRMRRQAKAMAVEFAKQLDGASESERAQLKAEILRRLQETRRA